MDADDFRDYMLSFLFLRYLSDNYEAAAKKELGQDYPKPGNVNKRAPLAVKEPNQDYSKTEDPREQSPLAILYAENPKDTTKFEKQMRRRVHYVIKPKFLWGEITEKARLQDDELLITLADGFKYIENHSFESNLQGFFSEINLHSEKLGRTATECNKKLCIIIQKIAEGMAEFSTDTDILGDAYEYLIGQFAAGSGRKAGEFYTPQEISTIYHVSLHWTRRSQITEPKSWETCWILHVVWVLCYSMCVNAWMQRVLVRYTVRKKTLPPITLSA